MTTPYRVGIAGLGTVGASVIELLRRNETSIAGRSERQIEVVAVSARDRSKARGLDLTGIEWVDDAEQLATRQDLDCVVEVIGGSSGVARNLAEAALRKGLGFVTANKAMLAEHGMSLARLAEESGAELRFEAAVAGGIPAIKALREGLAGNATSGIQGILNGTCNFILTEMRTTGRDFDDVLAEAQALGYAEADPTFDVDGIDAAQKLTILSAIAFGCPIEEGTFEIIGIRDVSTLDIDFATELGYRIKLLATARMIDGRLMQNVRPCLVPLAAPLAQVEGVTNAVAYQGDAVGTIALTGPGAGGMATASAIVSDIVDLAKGSAGGGVFGLRTADFRSLPKAGAEDVHGSYYLRLMVIDRPGVIADIATALGEHEVSIESVLQRGRDPQEVVPVVMVTHDTRYDSLAKAIEKIAALDAVVVEPQVLPIEVV